jgi:hypothetical protein
MLKKWGDWVLDYAKYLATVAVAYPFLSGLPKTWLYYAAVIAGIGILIGWGLYLNREKKSEEEDDPSEVSGDAVDDAVEASATVEGAVSPPAVVAPAVIASVSADADAAAVSAADTALVVSPPPPDVLPSDEPLPPVTESSIRSDE